MADLSPLTGRLLGHYRVIEKIGAGGMGEVYRAHDEHLVRDVAIKVLPLKTFTDDSARRHFREEALVLSRLNHPNIATIYDFDTQQGLDFLVMEYIRGVTLSERIANRALPEREIVRLGVQLVEGLMAAHDRGVIHRDLTPKNLRLTLDGRLKILDFGLAKLARPAGSESETESETRLGAGTLPYMSPEQLHGDLVDSRSDIWAAGTVLYEMATGRRPFQAPGLQVVNQILHQVPAVPGSLNPDITPTLDTVIMKCLEKEADARYQLVKELAVDLRRSLTGNVTPVHPATGRTAKPRATSIRSLAVLPLVNLSGDPQQEYFADGMTESIITDLGRLTGLKTVIARGSVMRYKNTQKPPAEIARELSVDALITGAVLQSGNRVRVTAQLIQPDTGQQLWAEHYEHDLIDILQLQNDVTKAIASEIRVKLTEGEQARLASLRYVNPQAYDAYLMGRVHFYKMTPQALDTALEYFQRALQKDPTMAAAHAAIGYLWGLRAHIGVMPSVEGWQRARAAAVKALELDDMLAEAHDALAIVLGCYDWAWTAAEREFQRAIELNPNYANVRLFYSYFLYAMRRSAESRTQITRALELDPHNSMFHHALGFQLCEEGRPEEAVMHFQRAITLQPDTLFAHAGLMAVLEAKGEYKRALVEAKEFFALLRATEIVDLLDRGYAQGGYRGAIRLSADALASKPRPGVSPLDVMQMYIFLGEKDLALDLLEKAFQERASRLIYINANSGYRPLHSNPRFREIVRQMNFPG
jgi:serine/threonine-protein kinase